MLCCFLSCVLPWHGGEQKHTQKFVFMTEHEYYGLTMSWKLLVTRLFLVLNDLDLMYEARKRSHSNTVVGPQPSLNTAREAVEMQSSRLFVSRWCNTVSRERGIHRHPAGVYRAAMPTLPHSHTLTQQEEQREWRLSLFETLHSFVISLHLKFSGLLWNEMKLNPPQNTRTIVVLLWNDRQHMKHICLAFEPDLICSN